MSSQINNYILWISTFIVIYHIVLYPSIIIYISKIKNNILYKNIMDQTYPNNASVSFIITAYNEEKVISKKIKNTLSLRIPSGSIEIIIAADGSDDGTVKIARQYEPKGVKILYDNERRGKASAMNRAVLMAAGEYIVFSDANNLFNQEAIIYLITPLQQDNIGAVCGTKKIIKQNNREASKGDSLYWRYESKIKKAESDICTTTALDGEIFAIRKKDYVPIADGIINDDSDITFNMINKGKNIKYENRAQSYEKASISLSDDYQTKVRMIAGGYQTLIHHGIYLIKNPGWFSFAFISHKVLRWIMPFILIAIFVTTYMTLSEMVSKIYCGIQVTGILFAMMGRYNTKKGIIGNIAYYSYYFILMNMAAFQGFIKAINSTQSVNWNKAQR